MTVNKKSPTNKSSKNLDKISVFLRLQDVINSRRKLNNADSKKSYIASLLQGQFDRPLQKSAEEFAEFTVAICDFQKRKSKAHKKALIHEAADLLFHLQIAIAYNNIDLTEIAEELINREGVGGFIEKANRKKR